MAVQPSSLVLVSALFVLACTGNDDLSRDRPEGPIKLLEYEAERGQALCVAISESAGRLAAGFSNDRVRLFSTEDGALVGEARGHRRGVTCLAFAPDGSQLVSAGPDRTVRVWATEPLSEQQVLEGAHEPLARVAFGPEGGSVLAVTVGGAIYSWSLPSGEPLLSKPGPVQRGVSNLDLSRHGSVLAWASDGGRLRTWDGKSGAKLGGYRIQDGLLVGTVAVDSTGKMVATNEVGSDRVEVWRMGKGLVCSAQDLGSPTRSLVFLGSRPLLAASSLAGVLHLIDVNDGAVLTQLDLPMGSVLRLQSSASGNLLAAAGPGRRILLWDVTRAVPAQELKRGQPLDSNPSVIPRAAVPDEGGLLDMSLLALPDYDPPELRGAPKPLLVDQFPADLRSLAGHSFRLRGFPLAASVEGEWVQTFLLSRFPPGCCFGSVPVMDEWVEVEAPPGTTSLIPDLRVEVQGVLEMGEIIGPTGFALSLYRMQAVSVDVIDG